MKKTLSFHSLFSNKIFAILFLIFVNLSLVKAQTKEEKAVLKTLNDRKESYYSADTTSLKSVWLHDSTITSAAVSKRGFYNTKGWNDLKLEIGKFRNIPGLNLFLIKPENIKMRVEGKLAFAEYDIIDSNPVSSTLFNQTSHDYEVYVKENNQWKVANHIKVFQKTFDIAPEDDMNAVGYKFLEMKKISEAIEVFKLNTKLYPNSFNVYDSLGEAYALNGETKLAIENYEKSLELNPDNKGGKEALMKLKK